MKNGNGTLFEILRNRALKSPASLASVSSERAFTYRRLWSRIERGAARLIGEWGVAPGDTLAYWGQGHQDALSLYFAVACCGARLLPLEHVSLQNDAAALLQEHRVTVLLHDDAIASDVLPSVPRIARLSSLVATRCHQYPQIGEDHTQTSLVMQKKGQASLYSLQQLTTDVVADAVADSFSVTAALFDEEVFAPGVLRTLASGGTIIFR